MDKDPLVRMRAAAARAALEHDPESADVVEKTMTHYFPKVGERLTYDQLKTLKAMGIDLERRSRLQERYERKRSSRIRSITRRKLAKESRKRNRG